MDTNRDPLELAAKAAGIVGEWVENYGGGDYYYQGNANGIYYEHAQGGYSVWNPLNDDGDALRLAVRLNISIHMNILYVSVDAISLTLAGIFIKEDCADDWSGAATRRAIVRAAAEIGRAMP